MTRRARALALFAGLFALALAALVAAGAWVLGSDEGFRWLTRAVTTLSGERIRFEGVEGHPGVPIGVERLSIDTADFRLEITGLNLRWRPRALWQRRLEIDALTARGVDLDILGEDSTPPAPPASLRAPLDLHLRAFDLARLQARRGGRALVLENLRGGLDGGGDRYRLAGLTGHLVGAGLSGELELAKDAPFALRGDFSAVWPEPGSGRAALALTGNLSALDFRLDASARDMRFRADGAAAPFAEILVPRLLVAGEGIDPSRLRADAPRADLAFSGVFEGQPGERLLGTFSLSNRLAGRLDQNLLPLANLTGAVHGDTDRADFSALLVDLGAAGRLTGGGHWRDGRVTLDLAGGNLNLAGLHRAARATRLAADLRLEGDADGRTIAGELREIWGQGRFRLSHADGELRLEAADFSGQAGRLTATGWLRLDASRAFAVEFDASRINPARFVEFPRARLNARGRAQGTLMPAPELDVDFVLPAGELAGRPVRGHGRLSYRDRHLADADIDLDLAGNRARFQGSLGRAGDRLRWEIDAPALARLHPDLGGRLAGAGGLGGFGDFDDGAGPPWLEADLTGADLRLPGGIATDRLEARLDLRAAVGAPFAGRIDARGVAFGDLRLQALRADASGRGDAHVLNVDASLPDWRLRAELAGGFDPARTWRGQLRQAELLGRWPMTLAAPAGLTLSPERQEIEGLDLDLAGGRLIVEHFRHQDGRFASQGRYADLPLAPLLALAESRPAFTTDLRVDGDWDLRVGDHLDGRASLRRRSGDLRLDRPALSLGLTALTLDLDAGPGRIGARLAVDSRELGGLRGEGRATLAREGGFPALARAGDFSTLARAVPLTWTARFDLPDLRPFKPYLPPGLRVDARLRGRLDGGGSLAAPRIEGELVAEAIRLALPEEGVAIDDGRIELGFDKDRIHVRDGLLKAGAGRVVVAGEARPGLGQAGIRLTFEKFPASQRGDRRIVVSGATRLDFERERLRLSGGLRVDHARLETPEASRPTLSADVVVVGRPPREQPAARRYPLDLDLDLDLGGDFLFKGGGLDARLGGRLRVFTVDQTLRGEGRVQVETGRYAAYGQSLAIERGVLAFAGPIDNPGLDILAVRETATVKAGVQVRGTARRPLVTLYSEPPLPDTEKLAWLVLGHGLDRGGQQEFALLQVAVGTLLGQAESVTMQARLADALHIDSFSLQAGEGEDLSSSVIRVGKRLSSRATLSYEQSLDGLDQVVKVIYQWTPRVRLEARTGQRGSFDAFYTVEYD